MDIQVILAVLLVWSTLFNIYTVVKIKLLYSEINKMRIISKISMVTDFLKSMLDRTDSDEAESVGFGCGKCESCKNVAMKTTKKTCKTNKDV